MLVFFTTLYLTWAIARPAHGHSNSHRAGHGSRSRRTQSTGARRAALRYSSTGGH